MILITTILKLSIAGTALSSHPPQNARLLASIATIMQTQGGQCPVERPDGRRLVSRFVGSPGYALIRSTLGLPSADSGAVRSVTGQANGAVCKSVFAAVSDSLSDHGRGQYLYSIFQVGNLYYVPMSLKRAKPSLTPGASNTITIHTGFTPVYVVDSNYRVVAKVAM